MTKMWSRADTYAMSGPRVLLWRTAVVLLMLECLSATAVAPIGLAVAVFDYRDGPYGPAVGALLIGGHLINVISIPVLLIGLVAFFETRTRGPLNQFQRRALLGVAMVCVYSIAFRWLTNGTGYYLGASIIITLMLLIILAECLLRLREALPTPL